jgi:hypothetical protein
MVEGLYPNTGRIFHAVSLLECVKPYILVGGTALSLQLRHRQSEDIDFMQWKQIGNTPVEVEWWKIREELEQAGTVEYMDILDRNLVNFVVSGVKISFYARDSRMPDMQPLPFLNNIRIADVHAIGAMKLEVLLRRYTFRDYYDIYAILKSGEDIDSMIRSALKYSGHALKSRALISMLLNSDGYRMDSNFLKLNPVYDVTPDGIRDFILLRLLDTGNSVKFLPDEIPYSEFEKAGISRNDLKIDDLKRLLNGEMTENKQFKAVIDGKWGYFNGRFSLVRNPDNTVSPVFHPSAKSSIKPEDNKE